MRAKVVVNATGAFCDSIRQIDDPHSKPMIAPSQGVHVMLDRSFLPGDSAVIVPRTSDGRVMFAIPWHGHTLVGTTDTEIEKAALEPVAMESEIEFLLQTASNYLARAPKRSDILSVFAGIRPLVKTTDGTRTAALSRDHTIVISKSNLLTIAGGKWTTYRRMAEDCVDQAAQIAKLDVRPCVTTRLKIDSSETDLSGEVLDARLPITTAQVVWAVRHEMARTVEDVLSRRTRALPLDAKVAIEMAPAVAKLMATELKLDSSWEAEQIAAFEAIARGYVAATSTAAGNTA